MTFLSLLITSIAGFFIIATLVPFIPRSEWWVRGFDFPRAQIAFLSMFVIFLCAVIYQGFWYEWLVVILLLFVIIWQLKKIFPFTPLHKPEVFLVKEPDASRQISVMISNVLMTNQDTTKLCEMVKNIEPDILLTLETNQYWENALTSLEGVYKYVVRCPQDDLYGMHLYSKLELINPEIQFLVEDNIPSIHTRIILSSGENIMLHCLHPAPPSPTENNKSIERDAELVKVAKRVKSEQFSSIVTGDLNDVAWSETTLLFRKISGLLDPRIGRGLFSTFHAKYWFFRWPLDHLFHSSDFALMELRRLEYVGSDHFPIYCKLQYMADITDKQDSLEPEKIDEELAEEKLTEVKASPSS